MIDTGSKQMESGRWKFFLAGCGCATLLAVLLIFGAVFWFPITGQWAFRFPGNQVTPTQQAFGSLQDGTPLVTPSTIQTSVAPAPVGTPILTQGDPAQNQQIVSSDFLSQLYQTVSPGVVSINVLVNNAGQSGQAAGSGFIIDEAGHIVTNNHVVENATLVIVVFEDGSESKATL